MPAKSDQEYDGEYIDMIRVSFVIPVYNSEHSIKKSVDELYTLYKKSKYQIEVILVNDGSTDRTDAVCRQITKKYPHVSYICLSKNFGQHNALLTGIRYAEGVYVVCLDDDLETPPKESIKLLNSIEHTHLDVVYGQYQRDCSWFRNIGSIINNMMVDFVFHKPHDVLLHSYFIMNRFVAKQISLYDGPFVYVPGLIFRVTQRVGGTPIVSGSRLYGSSNYSLKKLALLWINGITNYSLFPLRVSIAIGLFVAILGFIISLVIVGMRLTRPEIAVGWASTIATILVFGGLILLFIGFVGEYVGRIFFTLTKDPQSVIREIVRKKD